LSPPQSSASITRQGSAAGSGASGRIHLLPWDEWRATVSVKDATITWDHIARSPNCGIHKARRLLDYQPAVRALDAARESLMWLVEQGRIQA